MEECLHILHNILNDQAFSIPAPYAHPEGMRLIAVLQMPVYNALFFGSK